MRLPRLMCLPISLEARASDFSQQNQQVPIRRPKVAAKSAERIRWQLAVGFSRSSRIATKVAIRHPFWGGVSVATPGAEGTALLLVGQKGTTRRSAALHPATILRL